METKVKRGWKFRLFVYFLVLAVVALTVYLLQPRTYTAILDQLEKRAVAIETERNALPKIELKRKAVRLPKADGLW